MAERSTTNDEERRLAELGQKRKLIRNWAGFSIISILAGYVTGWLNPTAPRSNEYSS